MHEVANRPDQVKSAATVSSDAKVAGAQGGLMIDAWLAPLHAPVRLAATPPCHPA
jgi:hypothetical protein